MQAANESSNNLTIIENSLQKPNVRLMRHTAGELLQNKKESYQWMSNCWERLIIHESLNTYLHMNTLINWVLISLARCIMCRKQEKREESTGYKDCIKPPMVKVKLNFPTQYLCYDNPAKNYQPWNSNRVLIPYERGKKQIHGAAALFNAYQNMCWFQNS